MCKMSQWLVIENIKEFFYYFMIFSLITILKCCFEDILSSFWVISCFKIKNNVKVWIWIMYLKYFSIPVFEKNKSKCRACSTS